MNEVEYGERITADALQHARHAYDMLYDRIYRFATLVAGGGGAVGTYALAKLGETQISAHWIALLAVSVWLFFLSGIALWFGTSSNTLTAGTTAKAMRARINIHETSWTRTTLQQSHTGTPINDARETAFWLTRWDNLAAVDKQIESFSQATTRRAKALDWSHRLLMLTPVVAILAYWAAKALLPN